LLAFFFAQDVAHADEGYSARRQNQRPNLLPDLLSTDLTKIRNLEIPLILFEGRHDLNVNSELAAAWFEKVKAPEKHLVWFEHSGHIPMTEEPGKFLFSLVSLRAVDC